MSIPESHLAQEAIAALVDGELAPGPANRAARHLSGCVECRMAVQAQREAKEVLHRSAQQVTVPGDLLTRLQAIPVTGAHGSWAVSLAPHDRSHRADQARWLRRTVVGTLAGVGLGVTVLALNLPAGPAGSSSPGSFARPSAPEQHSQVVPPVIRTVTTGTSALRAARSGGTP
jgi:anti-sigma factor RsiW